MLAQISRNQSELPPSHRAVTHALVELCSRIVRAPATRMDARACAQSLAGSTAGIMPGVPQEKVTAAVMNFFEHAISEHLRAGQGGG